MKKAYLLLMILAAIIFSGCTKNGADVIERVNYPKQTEELCKAGGAEYKGYNTGCHDECYLINSVEPVKCTMAFSSGCDCGPDNCWNGQKCIPN